ncbi:MAG: hypothetical protein ABIN96_06055 [Rubrivivax sp.]
MNTLTLNPLMIGRPAAYKPVAAYAAAMAAAASRAPVDVRAAVSERIARVWTALTRIGALRAAADLRRLAAQRDSTDPDLSARMLALAYRIETGEA